MLVVDGRTKSVKIYDIQDGDHFDIYQIPAAPSHLASHDPGKLVVVGCKEGQIYVLNGRNGKIIAELVGHESLVSRVAVDSTGTLVISTSWDGTTRIWRAITGRQVLQTEGGLRCLTSDGKRLAISTISAGEFQPAMYDVDLPSKSKLNEFDRKQQPFEHPSHASKNPGGLGAGPHHKKQNERSEIHAH